LPGLAREYWDCRGRRIYFNLGTHTDPSSPSSFILDYSVDISLIPTAHTHSPISLIHEIDLVDLNTPGLRQRRRHRRARTSFPSAEFSLTHAAKGSAAHLHFQGTGSGRSDRAERALQGDVISLAPPTTRPNLFLSSYNMPPPALEPLVRFHNLTIASTSHAIHHWVKRENVVPNQYRKSPTALPGPGGLST
jgi:hypothetical protein